jgi:hypothetical protein
MPRYHTHERPQTISSMLNTHIVDDLKKLTGHLQKKFKKLAIIPKKLPSSQVPTRKAELIKWIATCLQDDAFVKALYQQMTPLEQAVLQETVHSPDAKLDAFRFKAKYGSVPSISIPSRWSSWRQKEEKKLPDIALLLQSDGTISSDLTTRLKKFIPKPKSVQTKTVRDLPAEVALRRFGDENTTPLVKHNTEQAAVLDLMALLQLVEMGKIGVSPKTGRVSKTGAKAIRKVLSHKDFYPADIAAPNEYDVQIGDAGIRPFAWPMLLQAGKLAQIEGSKLGLTKAGKTALKKPPHQTLSKLWQRWQKTTKLHEMNRIEEIKGQKSKSRPLAAAGACRQKIAMALSGLEPGVWIETEYFFKFLIAKGYSFNVARNYWALYLQHKEYGSFGYNHITWGHLEGRFCRAFLLEYAASLGLVDVALTIPWGALGDLSNLWGADEISCLSRYDGLWAFRINSLGAWILGITNQYVPEIHAEPSLKVLPNLEVTLMASSAAASDELFLDRCCERCSERVWRITLPQLLKAVEQGVAVKQVITFLTERNQGPLPQPVNSLFQDAQERAGKVKDIGQARLIECADPPTAHLIVNDSRLKNLCFLAGDHHVVVRSENRIQFQKVLRELGYALKIPE